MRFPVYSRYSSSEEARKEHLFGDLNRNKTEVNGSIYFFFPQGHYKSLKTYKHQLEKVPNLNCSRILKTDNVVLIYIKNLLMITKNKAEK